MASILDPALELRLDKRSPTPIYAQIFEGTVRYLIRSGMASGVHLPSERTLADELGVSRGTVRKAYTLLREQGVAEPLNGEGRMAVSPRLAEKRLEALPQCVGIVLLQPMEAFVGHSEWPTLDYLAGLVDASTEAGYSVTFLALPEEDAPARKQIRWHSHLCATVCGVIHFGVRRIGDGVHPAQQRLFDDPFLPQVFMSGRSKSRRIASVHADYGSGYLPAVEHLCQLGHRRIGFVAGPPPSDSDGVFVQSSAYREEGMRWALRQCGIQVRRDWSVSNCRTDADIEEAARRVLAARPRPTALLCQNDAYAVSLIEALRGEGLSVPDDISVIGYDNLARAGECDPPLTTVHQPRRAIGRRCFQLISRCREAGTVFDNVEEVLPAALVIRASVAPPRDDARAEGSLLVGFRRRSVGASGSNAKHLPKLPGGGRFAKP